MSLSPGTHVGPYEVKAPLGAGGMGEVYRARDAKLDRDVALKILPDAFTNDAERLARFRREAKVLASLNHPNIAQIHGLEDSGETHALVLELVDGPTLADRIAQGPIPVDEALPIAKQIAEALEAAHEQGIIHRDLKPANIKLRPDGTVKVLDFGLAKGFDEPTTAEVEDSPTLTAAATKAGLLLGTAAYMSPEQVKGRPVDRRADVWAFGCVLYEMLTTRQACAGESVSETIAAVLTTDVDLTALPADVPPTGRRLLRRCFEREPKKRLRDLTEELLHVEEDLEGTSDDRPVSVRSGPRVLPWFAAGVVAAVLAVVGVWNLRQPPSPARDVLSVTLPAGVSLPGSPWFAALSPDGGDLVFVGERSGTRQLYHRRLDQLDAVPLRDTVGATAPFFSPDGEWVGFFAGDEGGAATRHSTEIRKIRLEGGPSESVCALPDNRLWQDVSAAWGHDDTIWFGAGFGLFRVAAEGGVLQQVAERGHLHPRPLPNGRGILHTSGGVAVYDVETDEDRMLTSGNRPWYAPSGHVVFSRDASLWALPFDADQLVATGEPFSVLDRVRSGRRGGIGDAGRLNQALVGQDGTLVYVPASGAPDVRTLVWVDRRGGEAPIDAPARAYRTPRISPDGTRIAAEVEGDIWVHDLDRGTQIRLTSDPGREAQPLWSHDGASVLYSLIPEGGAGLSEAAIFRIAADGAGHAQQLHADPARGVWPESWGPDGTVVAGATPGMDIVVLDDQEDAWASVLSTPAAEFYARVSPDGRWLAYAVFDRRVPRAVAIQPYPDLTAGKWPTSSGYSSDPVWSGDGRELYYRDRDQGAVMAIPIDSEAPSPVGIPEPLFEDTYYFADMGAHIDTDQGDRFLMLKDPDFEPAREIVIIRHWAEDLWEREPADR